MKKVTLLFIILFASYNISSQVTEGYWMYGGSGNYTNVTSKSESGSTIKYSMTTIEPNFAYFLKDKWAIGGILNFRNFSNEIGSSNTYGLGILTRYYFFKPSKIYNIFAQTDFVYAINDADLTTYSQFYSAKIGSVIFFNSSVGLEFTLEYERGIYRSNTSSIINAGIGFQIHLEK
jgi:hypothetical protein